MMYQNRTNRKRPVCLICKQTFQPIGNESVCGRCDEQYVRRKRETIENQWEQTEIQMKYIEICKNLLADSDFFKDASSLIIGKEQFAQDSLELDHQIRDCFYRDLTPEQTVSEITEYLKKEKGIQNIISGIIGLVIVCVVLIIIFA